jgi:MFS family permease
MEKENRDQKNNHPHIGENVSLLPILTVNFIGTLGFSIVLPFLVFLVNRLGGNAFIYGLVSSMYPAFQLIGAPILGT